MRYQPPTIVRMQASYHSKVGLESVGYQKIRTEIDGVSIDDLVCKYGSPLFVYSEKLILKKYKEAHQAFSEQYPNVQFAWSYKTNYLRGICSIFHSEGSYAEVVSEFEYQKAKASGVPGKQIIYNGPLKSDQSLRDAIYDSAMIHVDNFGEIDRLEKIAEELNLNPFVAIRVNMDSGVQPQWSRFGFNLESGQALDAVKRIVFGKRLRLNGLHTHIGTFILDPGCYKTAASKLCQFMKLIQSSMKIRISYLDLGGGFPSLSQLIGVYQPPDVSVPSIEVFAKAICQTIKQNLPGEDLPKLFIEAGRHLVDEAGYLITSVVAQKLTPDGTRSYVLDAGVNLLYTSRWYRYNFELDRELRGPLEPAVLHGPLCMNIDVVCEIMTLPPLPRGTRMILSPVGAYNITQSMQFIQYRPEVVLVKINGQVASIRRRETLESIEFDERPG